MNTIIQTIERIEQDLRTLKAAIMSSEDIKQNDVEYVIDRISITNKILKALSENGEMSRNDITTKFRTKFLSRATILTILDDMESQGLLQKMIVQRVGRPLTTYKKL